MGNQTTPHETQDAAKQGARHRAWEYNLLNEIHDNAVALGAHCSGHEGEKRMNLNDDEAKAVAEETAVDVETAVEETAPAEAAPDAAAATPAEEEETTPAGDPQPPTPAKAISFNEMAHHVERAVFDAFERYWYKADEETNKYKGWPQGAAVYDGYAIVGFSTATYRAGYTLDAENNIMVQDPAEWTAVEHEWVNKRLDSTVVTMGDGVKALGDGWIGGYLVKFTDPDNPDLENDYFDAQTDFGPQRQSIVYYQHGLDEALGVKRLGARAAAGGLGNIKIDNVGVWIQAQLDLADEYEKAIYALVNKKKLGWSSGTAAHLVRREVVGKAHHITSWPLGIDASLTPTPASGPEKTAVIPLKQFAQEQATELPSLKALLQEAKTSTEPATAAQTQRATAPANGQQDSIKEILGMNPDELKELFTGIVNDAVAPLKDEVATLKTKLENEPPVNDPGHDVPEDGGNSKKEFDLMYNLKYGGKSDDETKKLVMDEVAGGNYRQFVWQQNVAFTKYVRRGTDILDPPEVKLLMRQVFAPTHVMKALRDGLNLSTVKDTMVEAQGSLGGFAVPPNMQENIARRLPGLTAVRGNGATVITLARGNSIEVPYYSGGDDRYTGNIRGQWGSETVNPSEQNATLGMKTIMADIYTYKIPMSTSLAEDAANLVDLVENDIVVTIAIDEDEAFLVGDGVGKPLGWLPGGLNTLSLTEVNSGGATALTTAGIKSLKRAVASQYRAMAVWVANSDTYGDIDALTVSGTGSDFAFGDLSDTGELLRRPALESEAMSDVAANTFPLLYVAMSGYYIVDRAGLTVMRMQDSNTGINKIELHVRKRVGGRPVETWKAAVQKVAS